MALDPAVPCAAEIGKRLAAAQALQRLRLVASPLDEAASLSDEGGDGAGENDPPIALAGSARCWLGVTPAQLLASAAIDQSPAANQALLADLRHILCHRLAQRGLALEELMHKLMPAAHAEGDAQGVADNVSSRKSSNNVRDRSSSTSDWKGALGLLDDGEDDSSSPRGDQGASCCSWGLRQTQSSYPRPAFCFLSWCFGPGRYV
jgi:hypothetical protein